MQNETRSSSASILQNPMLPDVLIWGEILPRLPVKPLTRFKSVSKDWRDKISSNEFVKNHLKFSSSRLQALILHDTYVVDGSCLISFNERDDLEEVVELDYNLPSYSPDHPPRGGSDSYVIGSSNGLVCLYEMGFCFYIWNPATNQCNNNVSSPRDFNFGPHDEPLGMGFGYVASINDYRIGLLINDYDDHSCNIYVYSLMGRRWITMASLDLDNEYKLGRRYEGVVVDDTLYWPPEFPWEENRDAHLVGLNLVTGEMEQVPLMMNLMNGYNPEVRVFRMRGCLSMCCYKYNYSRCVTTDVWMLMNQNDWEKVMSLTFEGMELLWLFENGKCLMKLDSNQGMLYDNDFRNEEGVDIWLAGSNKQFQLENFIDHAWDFIESLVSPFEINKYEI